VAITSGAHVLPGSAQAPTVGIASPAGAQAARSGEVITGTLAAGLFVPYAHHLPSAVITPGSGKLSEKTGLVNVSGTGDASSDAGGAGSLQPAAGASSGITASRPLTTG
jgi:hypothetical protein